ncbi:MAG: hypothetical protein R3F56_20260 [Planctomycetota bacterium]
MRSTLLLFLSIPSLLAAMPAQETATLEPSTKVAPLVVKTSRIDLAERLTRSSGQDVPEISAGEHYLLTMSSEGEIEVAKGNGVVALVEVEARPRVLMEMFADQVDQALRTAKMVASMAAASSPATPVDMAKMMDAMFAFPKQVETMTLRVDGDEAKGWDAHAEFVPVAKGDLEAFAQDVAASGKGAPRLGEGATAVAVDLAPKALARVAGALTGLMTAGEGKDQQPRVQKLLDAQIAASDGTMAMVLVPDAIRMVVGASDADAMHKLLTSGDWAELQRVYMASMPDADVRVEQEKVGDLDVVRTRADLGVDSPLLADGKMDGRAAVVGDMLISVVNGGPKAFEAMVQQVRDGKLERAPLANGAVLVMSAKIGDMIGMSGQEAPDGAPDLVRLMLGRKDKATLALDVQVRM